MNHAHLSKDAGSDQTWTGVVLAGGQSRRFGTDKALALLEDRPLLLHVLQALASVVDQLMLVVDQPSRYADLTEHFGKSVARVVDVYPQRGPLGGLYSAALQASTPWLLVTSCDTPLLEGPVLTGVQQRALAEYNGNSPADPTARAVVCRVAGRLHPFPGAYSTHSKSILLQALQKNALKMVDFLSEIQVDCLDEDDISAIGGTDCSFLNVNTPIELTEAQRRWNAAHLERVAKRLTGPGGR